jgi:cytochrome c
MRSVTFMDSFEWNKIIGAVLGTFMFVLILKIASEAIFEVPLPAKPGYVVEGVEAAPGAGGATAAPVEEAPPDWGTVLPTADVAAGKDVSQRCEQCHDLSKGGPNKIGPNLWGIVNRPRATHPGFDYSSAMSAVHDPWTYDNLFRYLKLPAAMVPGTKMSFAGLRSAQDRINLIAYLRTLADSPAPIPAPSPKKAAATPPSNTKAPATPTPANGAAAPASGTKQTAPAATPTGPAPNPQGAAANPATPTTQKPH